VACDLELPEDNRYGGWAASGEIDIMEAKVIRWYVDGLLYQTHTDWYSGSTMGGEGNPPYPAPFDQPFHLLINLAVGGNFDGDPDDTVKFPAVMEIDYVRVYE
jgi:beta-glucanase (GH16 family)